MKEDANESTDSPRDWSPNELDVEWHQLPWEFLLLVFGAGFFVALTLCAIIFIMWPRTP